MKRVIIVLLVGLLLVAGCGGNDGNDNSSQPATNADLNFYCSVSQGFNFKSDEQIVVGHLLTAQIGDQRLEADIKVTDPENMNNYVNVVGVLSNISWAGGYAQPIVVDCQVSNKNKMAIYNMTLKSMPNTNLTFAFNVYNYDPATKRYFKCFHTDGKDLNALVLKSGGELVMRIAIDASPEVESPKNYAFTFGATPQQSTEPQLFIATSVNNKTVMRWGVPIQ